MKIDATSSVYAAQRYRMIANRTVVPNTEKQGKDDIEISGEAASFAKVFNAARNKLDQPVDNRTHIEAVKAQISSGSFVLEPEETADSILMYI